VLDDGALRYGATGLNILETDHWCLLLPPEWWAEYEDDVVRIADNDEVGELEVTTLCKDSGVVSQDEVLAMAEEESPEISGWRDVQLGAFIGVRGEFSEDDAWIREWYMAAGPVLLYVTYICDLENKGMDDAAVEELLNTLVLGDEPSASQIPPVS
jgi:hypothetical protein